MSLDIALACAERGWLVHPCGEDKRPLTRWSEAATKDANEVRALWRRFPDALAGVVTGRKSNLYVIDIDRPGADDEAGLDLGGGVVVRTRREGGEHVYFSSPRDGRPVRNSAADGLDVRGDGGFVVSWHMPPGDTLQPLSAHVAEWARNRRGSSETGPAAALAPVIEEGGRESALVSLAGSMRRRGMGEAAILAALRVDNAERCRPPLDEADLERIAASVARYEAAEDPAQYGNILAAINAGTAPEIPLVDGNGTPTQHGIAVGVMRTGLTSWAQWAEDARSWYAYDEESGMWKEDTRSKVRLEIEKKTLQIRPGATATYMDGVERLIKVRRTVNLSDFDQEAQYLGVPGGAIDLVTGEHVDAGPGLMLTKSTAAAYTWMEYPERHCPCWIEHLTGLFGSADKVAWFKRLCGMSLWGKSEEKNHHFAYLVGAAGAGKGMVLRTLKYVLGDYVVNVSPERFAKGDRQHDEWKMPLRGARLALVEEMVRSNLSNERLLTLTGGDPIRGRGMRQNSVEWLPTHTFMMTSNARPVFSGGGSDRGALLRRYRPIENGGKVDHGDGWEGRVQAEAEAILAWMVEGCLLWQDEGKVLRDLAEIMDEAEEHLDADDQYLEWAEERMLLSEYVTDTTRATWTSRKDVLNNVNDWRIRRQWDPIRSTSEAREFYSWLRAKGARDVQSSNGRRDRGFDILLLEGPGS